MQYKRWTTFEAIETIKNGRMGIGGYFSPRLTGGLIPCHLDFRLYHNYSYWRTKLNELRFGHFAINEDLDSRAQRGRARHLAQTLSQQNPERVFGVVLQTNEQRLDSKTLYLYKQGKCQSSLMG